MMETKSYQKEAIETLQFWLAALQRRSKDRQWDDVPGDVWKKDISPPQRPFVTHSHKTRKNKAGGEIAHACFRMPTGSGKTYVAAQALNTIMQQWEKKQTGLVIWFVPLEKIYEQTAKAFRKGSWIHEYLTSQCGLPIQLVTKEDAVQGRLDERMLKDHLCILVLSQQSLIAGGGSGAKRENKTLRRIKRDTSIGTKSFPESSDLSACQEFHQAHPELDYKEGKNGVQIPKRSVVNFIRLNRPVVIIDEAHKTKSEQATKEISELNPSIILEISATPSHQSNVLYTATGRKVWEENMIKLPIQTSTEATWQKTLRAAQEKREELEKLAQKEHAQGGKYIRPIVVVRTEYTGKAQSDKPLHVDKVRRFMETKLGIHPDEIAEQSAEKKGELRNVNLLSETCEIRYILTKSALTEGWDCPFAYVLAILDNFKANVGVTQLMGRVMRQPYARKAKATDLNKAYVFCTSQKTGEVTRTIGTSLDSLNYKDAHDLAEVAGGEVVRTKSVRITERRPQFRGCKIYFPNIKFQDNGKLRRFNYDTDLVPRIDFSKLKYDNSIVIGKGKPHTKITEVGFDGEKSYSKKISTVVPPDFHYIFLTNELLEFIPNIFLAGRLVRETLEYYVRKYDYKSVYPYAPRIVQDMKHKLSEQYERLAKVEFEKMLKQGLLVANLEEQLDWLMPDKNFYEPELFDQDHNIFEKVGEQSLDNKDEKTVAINLEEKAQDDLIDWWFKSTTSKFPNDQESYYLQGWKRKRYYPDFLIAVASDNKGKRNYLVIDTKGEHLAGNEDTIYKEELSKVIENAMSHNQKKDADSYYFRVIEHREWDSVISRLLST